MDKSDFQRCPRLHRASKKLISLNVKNPLYLFVLFRSSSQRLGSKKEAFPSLFFWLRAKLAGGSRSYIALSRRSRGRSKSKRSLLLCSVLSPSLVSTTADCIAQLASQLIQPGGCPTILFLYNIFLNKKFQRKFYSFNPIRPAPVPQRHYPHEIVCQIYMNGLNGLSFHDFSS